MTSDDEPDFSWLYAGVARQFHHDYRDWREQEDCGCGVPRD